jgi:cyclic-di-GMP-binding biofilm dispersal mediator protein
MRVLLTGAASGLGAEILRACLARGDQVCALDLAPCADWAGAADWVQTDLGAVTDWGVLGAALAAKGPFDIVILNAGISATGPFETIALDRHRAVLLVNLHAPMQITAQLVRTGALAQGSRLVFIASLSCFTGYPGAASYAASKDGLAAFAASLRKPLWRERRVCVQVVCPGPMDTPHATEHAPKGTDGSRRMSPAKVAQTILRVPARRKIILPGMGAKLAALLGRVAPQTMTRIMGRVLFAKLKR